MSAMREWIEALRSGKYEQTYDMLVFDREQFCAAGVACEIYPGEDLIKDAYYYKYNEAFFTTSPPPPVLEWLGIERSLMDEVIAMNDHGTSFDEIADFLEGRCCDKNQCWSPPDGTASDVATSRASGDHKDS